MHSPTSLNQRLGEYWRGPSIIGDTGEMLSLFWGNKIKCLQISVVTTIISSWR